MNYVIAIILLLFGPLIVVATLRVGVASSTVRPEVLK